MYFNEEMNKLISKWSKEAGRPTAYKFDFDKKEITLYTRCPGLFIGLAGETINRYKKELCDILYIKNIDVKFVEVDGIVA